MTSLLCAVFICRTPSPLKTVTTPYSAKPYRRRAAKKRGPVMIPRNDLQTDAAAR